MMVELSVLDQQSVGKLIMKDVHSFCRSYNISYSVGYGTLIGAIRHHGFIPWDDDIDIIMPRPDYIRFCQEYKSDHFKLICHENDNSCLIAYARVVDNSNTLCVSKVPWCSQEVGMWIDVFPIDAVSDNEFSYLEQFNELKGLWKKTVIDRQAKQSLGVYDYRFIPTIKLLLKKIISANGNKACNHIEELIERSKEFQWGSTSHWSQLTCLDGNAHSEYMPIDALSSFSEVSFDDIKVMILDGYDCVLKNLYGDYMIMPPIENRIPHNNLLNQWFWK